MLINYLRTISTQKCFRWVILAFMISMFLINNPWFGQKHLESLTGGIGMIDMNWFNTPSSILDYLNKIGEHGRQAYILLLVLDSLLILSLFSFSGALIYRSLKNIGIAESYAGLIYIPFLRAVFDVIETLAMMVNTLLFPKASSVFISLASIATPLKWIFMGAMLALIITLLGIRNYRKIVTKNISVEQK